MNLYYFPFISFLCLLFSTSLQAQDWKTLSDKGTEAFYANQLQTASEYFQKAVSQAEKEFGKAHPNYVTSCTDLADTYRSLGLYTQAEPLYMDAKKNIDATTKEAHPYFSVNRVGLAELYQLQGKYEVAEPLYIEAKNAHEKSVGNNNPDYAVFSNNLAYLYQEMGLYPKAEALYTESLKIREKTLGKKHSDYAISCNNLAGLYLLQGLFHKSEEFYLEAKNIHEAVSGKTHPEYANTCNNLAVLYRYQKQYKQALTLFIEAKNIWEKTLGKNHPLYAAVCDNLGILYELEGNLQEAESLYLESKNIREKTLGKEHALYGQSCKHLGTIYYKKKQYPQAEVLYLESKKIIEKTLSKTHPEYASICNHLGKFYAKQGLYIQAESLFQEAIPNKINQIQLLLSTLSETERKAYLQSIDAFFEDFYVFAASYAATKPSITAEVFNLQLAIKGLVFQSTKKMQTQILQSGNKYLIEEYKKWKNQRAYLSKIQQLSLKDKEKQGISPEFEKKLADEINELERELSRVSELFVKTTDKRVYKWQDVQKQLKKGEALIEMIRLNAADTTSYMVLVVTPETQAYPQMLLLKNGEDLEGVHLSYYRNGIKFQREDKYSYTQYWSPIIEKFPVLKNKKRIYCAPDGVYHQVNLLTLQNPKTKKYVADETDIRLISNPKDLITFAQKPRKQSKNFKDYQIHLFGYPQYQKGSKQTSKDSLDKDKKRSLQIAGSPIEADSTTRFLGINGVVSMLPGTKIEVENIKKTALSQQIKTEVYLDDDASEDNIKKLQNPDFLHIATHGFFLANSTDKDDNQVRFADVETQKYAQNPLLRCGLLLAGAQNSLQATESSINLEDGILTANEAMNLSLDNTNLVVLSACETGLGEISNGEGVYGLQRAFQQAGAKTIMMSLWKVDDTATQEMMSLFYENLLVKKQNKRKAFQNAQNKLKKKFPKPYYWGAFVLVGE